jgi:bifunctional ADP-heptose synthase (sugar kinase/adenylyltransferase)
MFPEKNKYSEFTILIIGDSCSDKFTYGDVVRLAPEAPVPVFNPKYQTENKGMAGNVEMNLKAIGVSTILLTNEEKITKTRLVDERSNQILLRIDENDSVKPINSSQIKLVKNNVFVEQKIDAIIISDYDKGFLTEENIEFICKNNKNVFIDTKKSLGNWCLDASFIKINHVEYEHTKFNLNKLDIEKKLIVTMSNDGCRFNGKHFPVEKVNIKDVSGAGDTFISGLVSEFVRTNDIYESILFAQKCATKVVQKKGVTTI